MKMEYNILFISDISEIAGAEISLLTLIENINKKIFRPITVLPYEGPLTDHFRDLEIETIILPLSRIRRKKPFLYVKTVFNLIRLIRRKKINLVYSNGDRCNQYAVVAAKAMRIPLVCYVHNIIQKQTFWESLLWFSDILIANSTATLKSYRNFTRQSQKNVLIYNGVDLNKFVSQVSNKTSLRRKLGINKGTFIIGLVARINPVKGHHIFIQALAEAVKICPNICTLIVGEATVFEDTSWYLAELQGLTSELGLTDKVIFTGFIENMVELYECIDLLVLPSLAEPFGIVIIEAMAMGKPVITTGAGGTIDIVVDGVTGLIVPPENPSALAEAILKIIRDGNLAKKLGENGRKRVENLFTVKQYVEKIEEVFLDILGG